jgi:hypothetical protein
LRKRWLLTMNRKNVVNTMKKNKNKRERRKEGRKTARQANQTTSCNQWRRGIDLETSVRKK